MSGLDEEPVASEARLHLGLCNKNQLGRPTDSQLKHNTYQLLYIYSIPPDDGLQICPKHVEVD